MGKNVLIGATTAASRPVAPVAIARAAARAGSLIAPCWPLEDFVAVNPFLGLSSREFAQAAHALDMAAGAHLFMPRAYYAEAIAGGRICEDDLNAALDAEPAAAIEVGGLHGLRRAALEAPGPKTEDLLPTVIDLAGRVTDTDWPAFVRDRISRWAAAYFDPGQASWPSPWRHLSPYPAWRAEALIDRTPEVMGLSGFRAAVALLPESAVELLELGVEVLGIPEQGLEQYFHRILMMQGGWAAYARYRDWQQELSGQAGSTLVELLAIRIAWELVLLQGLAPKSLAPAWRNERDRLTRIATGREVMARYAVELLLQRACEHAWQKSLIQTLGKASAGTGDSRPAVQAAFCIDVRSEVYRSALEACSDSVETLGFAGFFGVPMAYVPLAATKARPQCPALLAPKFVIRETIAGASIKQIRALEQEQSASLQASRAWQSFKQGAVASFGFVETLGLPFLFSLLSSTMGLARLLPGCKKPFLKPTTCRPQPSLDVSRWRGMTVGLAFEERVALASSMLRGMSKTENFARLVLLAGHGSTSTNNPHAAGLNCGACGGHAGESNARVMAAILNDATVRAALAEQGIAIPEDTWFLAGNHDTTTDTVTLFDTETLPENHCGDLGQLAQWLAEASRRARRERAAALRLENEADLQRAFESRGHDWSQVRPEWGLAGCAAFIAAPRHRTRNISLDGRAFLHDYDWRQDVDFGVLEQIMTAPLVVASWINMQYYGSAVDNHNFGSGNKTLHNVVAGLGVLEGFGGDLRVGLPWQSVHDGENLVHDPLRLTAVIEAPVQAINAVIAKHENLRNLLDNGWLHLCAMDARGVARNWYSGNGVWAEIKAGERNRVAAA
jgi:uncharacterized protein YbcC (UPF0753/DUF2309 family)